MSAHASNVTATPTSASSVAKRKCQRFRRSARTSDIVAPPCSAAYSSDCVRDVVLIGLQYLFGSCDGSFHIRGGHKRIHRAAIAPDDSTRTYYASNNDGMRFDDAALQHDRIVHAGGGVDGGAVLNNGKA